MTWALILFILLGLIFGSFINMLTYRLPILLKESWHFQSSEFLEQAVSIKRSSMSLAQPRSFCPHCKTPLKWWHNIPLLGYLLLRGQCGHCHQSIPIRYLLTELLCGSVAIVIFYRFGINGPGIAALILSWGLIAASIIDIEEMFIPDQITFSLLWLGLLANTQYFFTTPTNAIYGCMLGYIFFWVVAKCFQLIRGKEGLGHGDFKLLAMLGAWMGVYALFNIILIASLSGLILIGTLSLLKKHNTSHPFPFGPFLALGGWCTILFGDVITNFFIR